jgi:hypothetical protein
VGIFARTLYNAVYKDEWPVISLKNDRTPTVLARTWRGTLQAHLPSGRAILVPPLLMSTTFPDGSVDHIPISVTQ